MPVWQVLLVAAAIAPLSACGAASPSADATPQRGTSASVGPTAAQQLPASASVKIGDKVIQLEVARTPVQLETGLMFRTSMPADRGMVFMVDPPRRLGFWMKDTFVPLDIVFVRDGIVESIAAQAPPCIADPCPVFSPEGAVDQVIEIQSGLSAKLGLKPGDQLLVSVS